MKTWFLAHMSRGVKNEPSGYFLNGGTIRVKENVIESLIENHY